MSSWNAATDGDADRAIGDGQQRRILRDEEGGDAGRG